MIKTKKRTTAGLRREGAPPTVRHRGMLLRSNVDVILYFRDARRGPGGALSFFPLRPRPYAAIKLYRAAFNFYRDAPGVDLGATLQRLFDLLLYVRGRDTGLNFDVVCDSDHTSQLLHRRLGQPLLVLPVH